MNRSPHMPNSGLRGIVAREHAARVAANRAQGPAAMAAVYAASTRESLPPWHASNWSALDYLNGSIGGTTIPGGK